MFASVARSSTTFVSRSFGSLVVFTPSLPLVKAAPFQPPAHLPKWKKDMVLVQPKQTAVVKVESAKTSTFPFQGTSTTRCIHRDARPSNVLERASESLKCHLMVRFRFQAGSLEGQTEWLVSFLTQWNEKKGSKLSLSAFANDPGTFLNAPILMNPSSFDMKKYGDRLHLRETRPKALQALDIDLNKLDMIRTLAEQMSRTSREIHFILAVSK